MAKNKNRGGSGFEKFGPPASSEPSPAAGTAVVIPVNEEDEGDIQEETDLTVPGDSVEPPPVVDGSLGQGPVPVGAYMKLEQEAMRATSTAEQEEILNRLHPKHNQMRDPALDYKRCLTSGRSLPVFKAKEGADPLLIRTKDLLERILAGGLLMPAAYGVYNLGVDLVVDIIKATGEPDAEPGAGSAGGDAPVGG